MSGLLETQRAGKCDYEIDRIWVVVKLHTIPCNIEFVFGITVSQMKAADLCLCRVRLYDVTRVVDGHLIKSQR